MTKALTPLKPEQIKAHEIGHKGSFLDGRAQLNVAAFFNEVDDMQLSIFIAQGASASVVRNAGQAETKGIEREGVLVPVDGLRLQASYGYLDAGYQELLDATQPVAGDPKVDSVGLLNLRLALTEIPLGEGEAALWVRNEWSGPDVRLCQRAMAVAHRWVAVNALSRRAEARPTTPHSCGVRPPVRNLPSRASRPAATRPGTRSAEHARSTRNARLVYVPVPKA